ncbi:MAG TPA: type II secretion system protein GspG, partial [Gammaproteobacteria bacterium]|nr:type II secretion system protein GspG [Gammaproteobacteria bacterium]
EALVEEPSSPEPANWKAGGYVDRLPKDPWNQDYLFLSPGEQGSIDIFSMGPDQVPSDDDIGNWDLQ